MGPLSRRPMQHIDRRELYTNLETRIQYLHSFLDFSSRTSLSPDLPLFILWYANHVISTGDIEALISGAKYLRALIPAVVNIVYKKLLQYDITARAFETRSTAYEGPMDGNIDEDSPQILHRKRFLRVYLDKLCSDPGTMAFWEYLDNVGMMHVGQGRVHALHVEYVHIGATLSFIQDVMTEAILSHPRLKMDGKIGLVKALSKVIWIQNDLFAKWYVRDGDEFAKERLVPEIEPEGSLPGKQSLHHGHEQQREDEEASSAMDSCPFKHLSTQTRETDADPLQHRSTE